MNSAFDSNSYIVEPFDSSVCWVIDFGFVATSDELRRLIDRPVAGAFLTHCHYDHICGLSKLIDLFPDCRVFGSQYTLEGLSDSKLNLSYYKGTPIEIRTEHQRVIQDQEVIVLFDHLPLHVIATPGHNEGCLSFVIDQYLFTGDSLIPGHEIVTKLKSGNKKEGKVSKQKLMELITEDTIICAGHGKKVTGVEFFNLA